MTFANGIFTATALQPHPDVNGGYWVFIDIGDTNNNPCACRKIEIVELTGYTLPDEDDNFNGGGFTRCDGVFQINEKVTGTNWQAFYEALSAANQCGTTVDLRSQTPFTLKFRVIDC